MESSKLEYEKPFAYEQELKEKLARQFELNSQLDLENAKVEDADLNAIEEKGRKGTPDSSVAEKEVPYRTVHDGKNR